MDDKIFFGVLVYLVLSTSIAALLPTAMYSGTKFVPLTESDVISEYNVSAGAVSGAVEQLNFMQKIVTYFFVTWRVAGIPAAIGIIIFLINILTIFVGAIYVYDKVRGIGS